MKSNRRNDTNYELVEQFMQHLRSMSPTKLTTFYCETCHDRLGTAEQCRPGGPFQESTGRCTNCERHDDVSNPLINLFLNERKQYLKPNPFDFAVMQESFDETTQLLKAWLIPDDYASFRRDDQWHKEEGSFTWIKYGRTKAKRAYREHSLSEPSKTLLQSFYPLCYSADRFEAAPIDEPVKESANELIDEPGIIELVAEPVVATNELDNIEPAKPLSTFGRVATFLASMF